jgi:hypothetical protein
VSRSDVEEFLGNYPESVKELAFAARAFVREALPNVAESVDRPAKMVAYRYGPGHKGLVCNLILSQKGVKLGVARGAELPDPAHLLTGAGKVHRHVQLRSVADLQRPELALLLREALAAWRSRNGAQS